MPTLALLLLACHPDPEPHQERTCRTDLEPWLATLGVPGLSVGIVRDGRLVCTAVAGDADREHHRPVTPDTAFAWASVSKTVTGTALMTLYDDGALDLDDDVAPYLPFPVDDPACPDQPITFRELLTHTSSVRDDMPVYNGTYTVGDSPVELGDFLRDYLVPGGALYDPDRNFTRGCPGEVYSYSNIGAGLIGYLVEQISGEPFEEYTRERLFDPLGMDSAAWHLADLDPSGVAMPYGGHDDASFEPLGHQGFPTYPDGLLRTSVPDLARFLLMFDQLGELDGTRILERSTAEEMRRLQLPARIDDEQALIWYYDTLAGHRGLLGHNGSDPGTASAMFFDPVDGTGALVVANGSWYDHGAAPAANALLVTLIEEGRLR